MVTVVNKTFEMEVIRSTFALLVHDGEDGANVLIDYVPARGSESLAHREAFLQAMLVISARGWNPATAWFEVMHRVESNTSPKLSWWESAHKPFDFPEAMAFVSGQKWLELRNRPSEPATKHDPQDEGHFSPEVSQKLRDAIQRKGERVNSPSEASPSPC